MFAALLRLVLLCYLSLLELFSALVEISFTFYHVVFEFLILVEAALKDHVAEKVPLDGKKIADDEHIKADLKINIKVLVPFHPFVKVVGSFVACKVGSHVFWELCLGSPCLTQPVSLVKTWHSDSAADRSHALGFTLGYEVFQKLVLLMVTFSVTSVHVDIRIAQNKHLRSIGVEGFLDVLRCVIVNDAEPDVIPVLVILIAQHTDAPGCERGQIIVFPRNGMSECNHPSCLASEPLTRPSIHDVFVEVGAIDVHHVSWTTTTICQAKFFVLCLTRVPQIIICHFLKELHRVDNWFKVGHFLVYCGFCCSTGHFNLCYSNFIKFPNCCCEKQQLKEHFRHFLSF